MSSAYLHLSKYYSLAATCVVFHLFFLFEIGALVKTEKTRLSTNTCDFYVSFVSTVFTAWRGLWTIRPQWVFVILWMIALVAVGGHAGTWTQEDVAKINTLWPWPWPWPWQKGDATSSDVLQCPMRTIANYLQCHGHGHGLFIPTARLLTVTVTD